MALLKRNLTFDQGATFEALSFIWKDSNQVPVDLSGYTAQMDFQDANGTPVFSLSTTTDTITLGTTNGVISFVIPASYTKTVTAKKGKYSLELYSPAPDASGEPRVVRFLEGSWNMALEVTKE